MEDPKTPDEEARELYYNTLSEANAILYGDVIGYFEDSDEITRTKTRCKEAICSSGFTAFTTPTGFSLDNVDLELLGTRRGINMLMERGKNSSAGTIVYGGWLKHSFFASEFDTLNHSRDPRKGANRIIGYALGYSSGENPKQFDGSAEWRGLMFGRDVGNSKSRGYAVRGDANIFVAFDSAGTSASVEFFNIKSLKNGTRYHDMAWRKLAVENGVFGHREGIDNYIAGRFFGPEEQEIGGVFEKDNVAGAFGGIREAR